MRSRNVPSWRQDLKGRLIDRLRDLTNRLVVLRRGPKRILLAGIDFAVLLSILWASISLRYGDLFVVPSPIAAALLLAAPLLTIGLLAYNRMYHQVTRFITTRGAYKLATVVLVATLLWALLVLMTHQEGMPRSAVLVYLVLAPAALVAWRQMAAAYLRWSGIPIPDRSRDRPHVPILVFGAGSLAAQFAETNAYLRTHAIRAFVDDCPSLVGGRLHGVRVQPSNRLERLIQRESIEEVVLALDHPSYAARRAILKKLEPYPVRVRVFSPLGSVAGEVDGHGGLRAVEGRDLLGRDPIPPDPHLLEKHIRGKSVLVTGAGGSIGSEIARQTVKLQPTTLVLLDNSEPALHRIELEVDGILDRLGLDRVQRPRIVAKLGSVGDAKSEGQVLRDVHVQTIFHAAAYKHVPMLERDPIAAVVNNTLATLSLAEKAVECNVERFVLISTDKAVRPTSVMGATKRMAELLIQDLAQSQTRTIFCAVRFGNVLGSSGSVTQRFEEQIQAGGPVTVTHPDMVRYFMSINEAASLVMQAASLAKGGETFLLEMGEPFRILELARSMIRLMGYQERTQDNPEGEIEIVYSGLRPGEKIIEELLTDMRSAVGTDHPRILQSREPTVDSVQLRKSLDHLRHAIRLRDGSLALAALNAAVDDYQLSPPLIEQLSASKDEVLH